MLIHHSTFISTFVSQAEMPIFVISSFAFLAFYIFETGAVFLFFSIFDSAAAFTFSAFFSSFVSFTFVSLAFVSFTFGF